MCECQSAFTRLLTVVEGEFREMPCLKLTKDQIKRMWSLDQPTCDAMLETLQARHVLRAEPGGKYARDEDEHIAA